MAEEWELCLSWLQRCKVLPQFMGKDVSDFAQCLRDGVILCQLITTLKPNIEPRDYSLRPQMSQFLCLKNIRWFLNACRDHFKMKSTDLFDLYDLFDLKDFKRVMNTLSKLSINELAVQQGYSGFQHQEEDIYKNLEDLNLSEMPDEDIYGPIGMEEDGDKIYDEICSFKKGARSSVITRTMDKKTKTDYCIEEILVTEKNYVDALQMINEKFAKAVEISVQNPELMKTVFINIKDIYKVHKEILHEVQLAVDKDALQDIAKIFLKSKKALVIYGDYCAGLPRAQSKVDELMKRNDNTKRCILECEEQANEGRFRLRDLLVVPMQRVMKYSLLLRELKKNLEKDKVFEPNGPEMTDLEKAMESMNDLMYYVNEVKRDSESLDTISMIERSIEDLSMPPGTKLEDYGHLLKDGELKVRFHEDNRELKRYIFLFDKVMLMCKSRGETYSYKTALVLHEYKLEDVAGGPIKVLQWRHSFMLVEKTKQTAITFFSKNEEQKKKWLDSINMAVENFSPPHSKDGGFDFIMHTFTHATECDSCGKLLVGRFYQGYLCSNTKKKAHKHCIDRIVNRRTASISSRRGSNRYKATHTYNGLPPPPPGKTFLRFSEGDLIDVENLDEPHWWLGTRAGTQGYFPAGYVQKLARTSSSSGLTNGARTSHLFPKHTPSIPRHSTVAPLSPSFHRDYVNTDPLKIPSKMMSDYAWYIGTFNKTEASHKLNAQEDGVFLVRESKDRPGTYAIGIAYQGTAKHIKISKNPHEEIYSIADYKCFDSIPKLIQYYETHTLQDSFPELTTTLLIPYNRRAPRSRAGSSASFFGSTSTASGSRSSRRSMPPIIGKALVSFDYSSTETNQINLSMGDYVAIISKAGGDRGWWKGAVIKNEQLERVGYFPLAYVQEIEDDGFPF